MVDAANPPDPWNEVAHFGWRPVKTHIPEFKGRVVPGILVSQCERDMKAARGADDPRLAPLYNQVFQGRVVEVTSSSLGGGNAFYVTDPLLASTIEATRGYQLQLEEMGLKPHHRVSNKQATPRIDISTADTVISRK